MVTWNSLSKCLYDFENAYGEELGKLKFDGFNAWQIVKVPLYFNSIGPGGAAPVARNGGVSKLAKKGFRAFSLFASLARLSLKPKRRVLFFTFSGDKLAKDEQGHYFNFLTDAFIANNIVQDYVYAEASLNGDFKQPSKVPIGFKVDLLYMLYPFFKRLSRAEVARAQGMIDALHQKLDEYLKANIGFTVSRQQVSNIFASFAAERRLFNFFLRICKPGLIITSEKPGRPLMAAANSRNIPTLDMQHGVIDKHDPQYVYAASLAPYKKEMILPRWLGLFGSFHKQALLHTHFWKEDELLVLGSARMEMNRTKYKKDGGAQPYILVPTQWTYFPQTCAFLQALLPALPQGCKIILKLHPLEKEEYVQLYHKLKEEQCGHNLEISGKNQDIYPLISACRMVIGFDSAVLLEATSLGTPCITLCTEQSPEGIHSLFANKALRASIRPVPYSSTDELLLLVKNGLSNENYYQEWKKAALNDAENLYAAEYSSNCAEFINKNSYLK